MSSPEQYTPRDLTALDWLLAAKRTADSIVSSNPLTNAVISRGLMRWTGNHLDVNGEPINFLWIGEFLPADTTMGGIPQRGIAMWRDDSAGAAYNDGVLAFALYDHTPGEGGLGLRQTLHVRSVDNNQLYTEARHGGLQFPHAMIPMYEGSGTDRARWPSITSTSFVDVLEGYVSCTGNHVYGRYWVGTPAGVTAEFRMTASWSGGSTSSPIHTQPGATFGLREDTIDVTGARGQAGLQIKIQARVASGAGSIEIAPIRFENFTDAT